MSSAYAKRSGLILETLGLLRLVRWCRRFPQKQADRRRFIHFKQQYQNVLKHNLNGKHQQHKNALVVNGPRPLLKVELALIKALEIAGFAPIVLVLNEQNYTRDYYELAGVKEVLFWTEFLEDHSLFLPEAEAVIERHQSVEDFLTFEYAGVRVGKIAASTTLRHLRRGSLDLTAPDVRQILVEYVAVGMAAATAAQKVLNRVQPQLALSLDAVYTKRGELFDSCLVNGVDVFMWYSAHKSNTLMLKRYTLNNREEHPSSLSPETWQLVREMKWTEAHRDALQRELYDSYASGDWYSESGTQFNTGFRDPGDLRKQLGLNPIKKTAFIFSHIPWDASFSWGENLFDDYEKWFIETVRAACNNDCVNWVIKIHPANVSKGMADSFRGEPAEVKALGELIDNLPSHVFLIPAESDISTFSLFALMDYCLTVRGTVGIEAASFGIPVLTAGTGRYDQKGFTVDSESSAEYLERISHIQEILPLSAAQRELAERFAYGTFLLRPFPLKTVTLEYGQDYGVENNFIKSHLEISAKDDWYKAADLKLFAQWVTDSRSDDFVMTATAM